MHDDGNHLTAIVEASGSHKEDVSIHGSEQDAIAPRVPQVDERKRLCQQGTIGKQVYGTFECL